MPNFAANLTMLFNEVPFMERFKLAKESGFDYVEYLFPYEYDALALKQTLEANQLKQVLFNLPPGNWESGERGIACLPDRIEEFKSGVHEAIFYAKTLGVNQLNCLSGLISQDHSIELQRQTLQSNVQYAAQELSKHNLTLMIEPINSKVDMPGFFLDTLDKTIELIQKIDEKNIKIQFDIYHMQIMHGDLIRLFQNNIHQIGHIQFADNPGRHEPGTGEINFSNIFKTLDILNYQGFVSAEYKPSTETVNSLDWLNRP